MNALKYITHKAVLSSAIIILVTGCASIPTAPTSTVLPTVGKPLDLFETEDKTCRTYAQTALQNNPQTNAKVIGAVTNGVVGTLIGAAFGGLINGNSSGARYGAITGGITGAIDGIKEGSRRSFEVQNSYDMAYQQCMASKGNIINKSFSNIDY